MSDKLKLDNGFFEVSIKPDAFALGEYFAGLNSEEQARFLKGFVSAFESYEGQWAFQAGYIADELNGKTGGCNGVGGVSVYKQEIIYYLQTLLEQLED